MRLWLKLKLVSSYNKIPINYYYQFSSAIYLLLRFGSDQFSRFLHDIGFENNGRKFKMFTFGVTFDNMIIDGKEIKLIDPIVNLYITSPLLDTFIHNLVLGTFKKQNISITSQDDSAKFEILQIEAEPPVVFSNEEKFRMVSPLVCSTKIIKDGKPSQYYYRYTDKEIVDGIKNNLINKYKALHKNLPENTDLFEFEFDKNEIERKKGRVSKLITIAEGTSEATQIKAIFCGFRIKADPELIKTGYECGFGEKNSMGFGMVR